MPRLLRRSARVGLLVVGSVVIAAGVAVMLWTDLGPGPLDVFIGAVRVRTGLSLTLAVWLVIAALVGVAWLLGRRPGPGTVASPLIVGPVMQAMVSGLDGIDPPRAFVLVAAIHVAAVFVVGLGAGALIVSGLGAGSGELLASAASGRTGRPEPRNPHGHRADVARRWSVAGRADRRRHRTGCGVDRAGRCGRLPVGRQRGDQLSDHARS